MSLDISDAVAEGAGAPRDTGVRPTPGPRDPSDPADPAVAGPPKEPDFRGKGPLLELADRKRVAKRVAALWKSQDPTMRPRLEQWRANELTMAGVPGVRLIKDTDTDTWIARVPFGASAERVGIPKTKELADKVTAVLTVDPPAADAQPSPDDQGDMAKAEMVTRLLRNECTEAGLDLHGKLRAAASLGATYGSGFLVIDVDPTGGGWEPLAIDAHPAATHFDPADPDAVLQHPMGPMGDVDANGVMAPPPPTRRYLTRKPAAIGATADASGANAEQAATDGGYATIPGDGDPLKGITGEPLHGIIGASTKAPPAIDEPPAEESPAEEAPTADGRIPITDDPTQAARSWQLKLRASIKTGRQLRFLPLLATGVDDADGVILADVTTFGALRGAFPWIDTLPREQQTRMMTWDPVPKKDLLPPGVVVDGDGTCTVDDPDDPRQGLPADEALCVTMRAIYHAVPAYPEGAEVLCAGAMALHRDTRCVWIGEADARRPECLDLNVVQARRHDDDTGGNPYGIGDAQLLGPGDELIGQLLMDAVARIWEVNHPLVLLPYGSIIQPGQLETARAEGTAVTYNPAAGGPVIHQAGGLDPNTLPMADMIARRMDARAGLEDAQQLNNPNVTSGKQANTIVEQSLTILSPINANFKKAASRAFRVTAQLYRAYATQPMLLRFTGEDGRYQVQEFTNADLGSARDVRIAAGTSTMLSQSAKRQLAENDLAISSKFDPEGAYRRYQQSIASNVDPILGRDQDPHHHRVMRQIHAWRAGPPAGQEAPPPPAPVPQPDPMTGATTLVQPPAPDPLSVPDPRALPLFQPVPVDAQPDVAKTRALALGDELARESTDRLRQTAPAWVLAIDAAYDKARQDAGFQTIAEQQAAQQQAQAAQQQQQQASQERASAEASNAQTRQLDAETEQHAATQAAGIERARIQSASRNSNPSLVGAA